MGATAILKVKEILFEGIKVRLETGEEMWIRSDRIEDYVAGGGIVVPAWYEEKLMKRARGGIDETN